MNDTTRNIQKYKILYRKIFCSNFELKIPLDIHSFSKYKLSLESCCIENSQRKGYRNRYYYFRRKNPNKTAHANYFTCYDNEDLFSSGISDISIIEQRLTGGEYYNNDKTVSASITFQVTRGYCLAIQKINISVLYQTMKLKTLCQR